VTLAMKLHCKRVLLCSCLRWEVITSLNIFEGIVTASPLKIQKTGNVNSASHVAPFDASDYKTAIEKVGRYTCGGNMFWVNFLTSTVPGVPINARSIEYLMAYAFSSPDDAEKLAPKVFCVAVDRTSNPLESGCKGKLKSLSPDEIIHALVHAIARDIKDNKPDEVLQLWRRYVLTRVMEFSFLTSADDVFYAATNQREKVGAEYEALYYTAVGNSMSVRQRASKAKLFLFSVDTRMC
jgi:hypothetical protein